MPAVVSALVGLVLVLLAVREATKLAARRPRAPRNIDDVNRAIDDPRRSGAVLLVQLALYRGDVSAADKAVMITAMRDVFEVDALGAEALFSFGRMAAGQLGDAASSLTSILRPVKDRCTLNEMKDLAEMLDEVDRALGPETDQGTALRRSVRQALHLPDAAAMH